mmetsp:Transcript_25319/g.52986  ORF Transcript_25319/g.52986 Transcript_25319/m.52986 type:complete len:224 (+) Transcript_25319:591-1262(+)
MLIRKCKQQSHCCHCITQTIVPMILCQCFQRRIDVILGASSRRGTPGGPTPIQQTGRVFGLLLSHVSHLLTQSPQSQLDNDHTRHAPDGAPILIRHAHISAMAESLHQLLHSLLQNSKTCKPHECRATQDAQRFQPGRTSGVKGRTASFTRSSFCVGQDPLGDNVQYRVDECGEDGKGEGLEVGDEFGEENEDVDIEGEVKGQFAEVAVAEEHFFWQSFRRQS